MDDKKEQLIALMNHLVQRSEEEPAMSLDEAHVYIQNQLTKAWPELKGTNV